MGSYDAACSKCAVGLQSVFLLFSFFFLARGARLGVPSGKGPNEGNRFPRRLRRCRTCYPNSCCSRMTLRAVYLPQVLQSSFLFLFSFRLIHFGETDEQREKRLGRRPRSLICLCCGKNEILHQALRNSGPLDLTVTICHRGECFCLLYSTLLEGGSSRSHSDNLSPWRMFLPSLFNSVGGRPRTAGSFAASFRKEEILQ